MTEYKMCELCGKKPDASTTRFSKEFLDCPNGKNYVCGHCLGKLVDFAITAGMKYAIEVIE
jgi:predicted SprT family Zn-dependent metalloprotease